jgi:hypothetical protein
MSNLIPIKIRINASSIRATLILKNILKIRLTPNTMSTAPQKKPASIFLLSALKLKFTIPILNCKNPAILNLDVKKQIFIYKT